MKIKFLILFIVFFGCFSLYAQREIQPEIGASVYTSQKGYYERGKSHEFSNDKIVLSDNSYSGLNLKLGARFVLNNKSLLFNFQYQFLQNNGFGIKNSEPQLKSKLIGIGGDFRLFEQKRVRMFFQMALLTEISTNYQDGYLEKKTYQPINFGSSDFYFKNAERNLYKGTPFIGNSSIGCNVKIMYGLSLNLSVGYSLRFLRSQYVKLSFDEDQTSQIPKKITYINNSYLVPFHMIDLQAGLNYSFSLHNNQKSKEKLNSFSNVFKSGVDKLSRQIVQPEVGTSIYTSNFGLYNVKKTREDEKGKSRGLRLSNSSYYGLRAYAGARFLANNRSLSLNFEYQYLEDGGSGLEGNRIVLKSNQVGLGAEFRMFEQNKVRLFFKMTTLTEVSSNFINSYLKLGTYEPTDFDLNEKYIEHPIINIYKGTPLLNTLSIGSNIKMIKGLNLNFAIDYSMRLLRIEQGSMSFQSNNIIGLFRDTPDLIPFHMFGFQAGLNYEFSVKKKPKMEMP